MENRAPGPGRRTRLRGRSSECALLDDLVSAIRRGESRSLVLRGEAGIGKTALLEYLIATASTSVQCAPGQVAISGGGVTTNGNAVMTTPSQLQHAATAPPNELEVDYRNDQAVADVVFATVVCATP